MLAGIDRLYTDFGLDLAARLRLAERSRDMLTQQFHFDSLRDTSPTASAHSARPFCSCSTRGSRPRSALRRDRPHRPRSPHPTPAPADQRQPHPHVHKPPLPFRRTRAGALRLPRAVVPLVPCEGEEGRARKGGGGVSDLVGAGGLNPDHLNPFSTSAISDGLDEITVGTPLTNSTCSRQPGASIQSCSASANWSSKFFES